MHTVVPTAMPIVIILSYIIAKFKAYCAKRLAWLKYSNRTATTVLLVIFERMDILKFSLNSLVLLVFINKFPVTYDRSWGSHNLCLCLIMSILHKILFDLGTSSVVENVFLNDP